MVRRLLIWCFWGFIALAIYLFVVVPLFIPWSEFNCRHEDVDINSGRLRFTSYLLYLKTSERIEDTPLAGVLPVDLLACRKPEWRRVNTFSPGVHHSPHYKFHAASYQIRDLSLIWEMNSLSEPVRQKTALHLLALWRHSQSDFLASDYLQDLGMLMTHGKRPEVIETILRLEMPKIETEGNGVLRTVFYPSSRPLERTEGYVTGDGKFVPHGLSEHWHPNGKRESYCRFENGEAHGRWFSWDCEGKLIEIRGFTRGVLTEYEAKNLERHPDYKTTEELTKHPQ